MTTFCVRLDGDTLPDRSVVGGKAWSLARMRKLGLPSPPAFVLPTSACHEYHASGMTLTSEIETALVEGIAALEAETGRTFGGSDRPLLVSVRSGAPVSMPGMMDTVLNLGCTPEVERALARESSHEIAGDIHFRFLESYGRIVLRAVLSTDGSSPAEVQEQIRDQVGSPVSDDPWEQLREATAAVFRSWHSRRAKAYRRHAGIPDDLGTAVTVQAMVYGNLGESSGTGVLFSRDPITGDPEPYGEYLPGGQGEDVVSGEVDPVPLSVLKDELPEIHQQLLEASRLLELENRDVQDIEFTVEQGRLFLLQTRSAKRSPKAAVRIAVDLTNEGVISRTEAVERVTAEQLEQILAPRLDDDERALATVVADGSPASPGVGVGIALSDCDEVVRRSEAGENVVFLAKMTSPEDIQAMIAATAVVTETGGSTSHAAVVCRGLGRPAVVSCGEGVVDALEGRPVTVDGDGGIVYAGQLALRAVSPDDDPFLKAMTAWRSGRAELVGGGQV